MGEEKIRIGRRKDKDWEKESKEIKDRKHKELIFQLKYKKGRI